MTIRFCHVTDVVNRCKYPGYSWLVLGDDGYSVIVQGVFEAPCNVNGGEPVTQYTRKWVIDAEADDGAIVRTLFKLVLTSIEHEAREQFTVDGKTIFQPHFNLDQLLENA